MIKDIAKFEEILKRSIAKEYEMEEGIEVVLTKTNEMYNLAATEVEDENDLEFHKHLEEISFELMFDPINMALVWFRDEKEIGREDYSEEEIIDLLESGGYYDMVLKYEDCYNDEDEIDND